MHKTSEKWLENIAKFKLGSIALIDQITTISKMRICQPVTKDDPLYGIKLTSAELDEIDIGLKNLYFIEKNNT